MVIRCHGGCPSTKPHPLPSQNGSIPSCSPPLLSSPASSPDTDINSMPQDGSGACLESRHPEKLRQEDCKLKALRSEFEASLGDLLIVSVSN